MPLAALDHDAAHDLPPVEESPISDGPAAAKSTTPRDDAVHATLVVPDEPVAKPISLACSDGGPSGVGLRPETSERSAVDEAPLPEPLGPPTARRSLAGAASQSELDASALMGSPVDSPPPASPIGVELAPSTPIEGDSRVSLADSACDVVLMEETDRSAGPAASSESTTGGEDQQPVPEAVVEAGSPPVDESGGRGALDACEVGTGSLGYAGSLPAAAAEDGTRRLSIVPDDLGPRVDDGSAAPSSPMPVAPSDECSHEAAAPVPPLVLPATTLPAVTEDNCSSLAQVPDTAAPAFFPLEQLPVPSLTLHGELEAVDAPALAATAPGTPDAAARADALEESPRGDAAAMEAPSDAATEAPSDAAMEAPSDAATEAPSDAAMEAPSDVTERSSSRSPDEDSQGDALIDAPFPRDAEAGLSDHGGEVLVREGRLPVVLESDSEARRESDSDAPGSWAAPASPRFSAGQVSSTRGASAPLRQLVSSASGDSLPEPPEPPVRAQGLLLTAEEDDTPSDADSAPVPPLASESGAPQAPDGGPSPLYDSSFCDDDGGAAHDDQASSSVTGSEGDPRSFGATVGLSRRRPHASSLPARSPADAVASAPTATVAASLASPYSAHADPAAEWDAGVDSRFDGLSGTYGLHAGETPGDASSPDASSLPREGSWFDAALGGADDSEAAVFSPASSDASDDSPAAAGADEAASALLGRPRSAGGSANRRGDPLPHPHSDASRHTPLSRVASGRRVTFADEPPLPQHHRPLDDRARGADLDAAPVGAPLGNPRAATSVSHAAPGDASAARLSALEAELAQFKALTLALQSQVEEITAAAAAATAAAAVHAAPPAAAPPVSIESHPPDRPHALPPLPSAVRPDADVFPDAERISGDADAALTTVAAPAVAPTEIPDPSLTQRPCLDAAPPAATGLHAGTADGAVPAGPSPPYNPFDDSPVRQGPIGAAPEEQGQGRPEDLFFSTAPGVPRLEPGDAPPPAAAPLAAVLEDRQALDDDAVALVPPAPDAVPAAIADLFAEPPSVAATGSASPNPSLDSAPQAAAAPPLPSSAPEGQSSSGGEPAIALPEGGNSADASSTVTAAAVSAAAAADFVDEYGYGPDDDDDGDDAAHDGGGAVSSRGYSSPDSESEPLTRQESQAIPQSQPPAPPAPALAPAVAEPARVAVAKRPSVASSVGGGARKGSRGSASSQASLQAELAEWLAHFQSSHGALLTAAAVGAPALPPRPPPLPPPLPPVAAVRPPPAPTLQHAPAAAPAVLLETPGPPDAPHLPSDAAWGVDSGCTDGPAGVAPCDGAIVLLPPHQDTAAGALVLVAPDYAGAARAASLDPRQQARDETRQRVRDVRAGQQSQRRWRSPPSAAPSSSPAPGALSSGTPTGQQPLSRDASRRTPSPVAAALAPGRDPHPHPHHLHHHHLSASRAAAAAAARPATSQRHLSMPLRLPPPLDHARADALATAVAASAAAAPPAMPLTSAPAAPPRSPGARSSTGHAARLLSRVDPLLTPQGTAPASAPRASTRAGSGSRTADAPVHWGGQASSSSGPPTSRHRASLIAATDALLKERAGSPARPADRATANPHSASLSPPPAAAFAAPRTPLLKSGGRRAMPLEAPGWAAPTSASPFTPSRSSAPLPFDHHEHHEAAHDGGGAPVRAYPISAGVGSAQWPPVVSFHPSSRAAGGAGHRLPAPRITGRAWA